MKRANPTNRKNKQHINDKDTTVVIKKPIKWTYGGSSQVKTEQTQLSRKVSLLKNSKQSKSKPSKLSNISYSFDGLKG